MVSVVCMQKHLASWRVRTQKYQVLEQIILQSFEITHKEHKLLLNIFQVRQQLRKI